MAALTISNAFRERHVTTGFAFLSYAARFDIGESLIPYSGADSYAKALLVGGLNTVKVAIIGILVATALGAFGCLCRLSSNPLLSGMAAVFTEVMRNIPPLLQLFIWYAIFSMSLPAPRQALRILPGTFLSNRGMWLPKVIMPGFSLLWLSAPAVAAFLITWFFVEQKPGRSRLVASILAAGLAILLVFAIAALATGSYPTIDWPLLKGLNYRGGTSVTPEFAALTLGLSLYTSGFLAAIFHSAIKSVPIGQKEAAVTLGFRPLSVIRLIVLPQAIRIALPSATNQWINLGKNSSLAVAIGYPDFVSIGNTTISLTGQAVELVALFMTFYTALSLIIALIANLLQGRNFNGTSKGSVS